MGTTADKLELLLRTKERQKAYLQEKYPLLDFDTIPFRSYLDLFQGRSYVPGLVAAWKTYGKRNDDADRDNLYDYSGNGRDIELFNFAFAGMSGYGGYVYDEGNIIVMSLNTDFVTVKDNKIAISNMTRSGTCCYATSIFGTAGQSLTVNVPAYRIKVSGLKEGERIDIGRGFNDGESATWVDAVIPRIYGDGVYDIPAWDFTVAPASETAVPSVSDFRPAVYPKDSTPMNVTIEILPLYPGALVSDGVDDYGIVDNLPVFTKETGYTVLAIRKWVDDTPLNQSFVSNLNNSDTLGAFSFEIAESSKANTYSFGGSANTVTYPALFSYQTLDKYNSEKLTNIGTSIDGPLWYLFRGRDSSINPAKVVLYDLRIYDHSLTAEELQTVKDEMMSDYEKDTGGGITDITYVADWDGKGRSNDEEETMRSQWTDKVNGRVINLSNYAYSQMSGWNGYRFDWSTGWSTDYQSLMTYVEKGKTKAVFSGFEDISASGITVLYNQSANIPSGTTIRIKGTGFLPGENWYCIDYASGSRYNYYGNGVLEFTTAVDIGYLRISIIMDNKTDRTITLEQLPVYPGALVSDGIDDRIQAEEALGEVGTVLIHWKNIGLPAKRYLYNTGWEDDAGRLYCWNTQGTIACGKPHMQMDGHPIMVYHRSPLVSTVPLNNNAGENNCPIFRLIFIKEQLDDAQQEFLMWKVSKEYRDWLKEKGYDYAIDEMLNN